eukprot:CAMPEP_0196658040 /NCGR_PEP_ID=MMETSP1086-20130531/26834_1 /TAXON_ID=77921 /ORGANISM="Cyanoptyche  gloeocystis , Strain SAG4.97" /LENGTH=196 /DNA_ID=CAMNT_0041991415 /DNA_START=51 /DNA_END=638 /DNA_ORIENTATION=-
MADSGSSGARSSKGSIFYAMVSRGVTILAEFTTARGNFGTIVKKILESLPPGNDRASYAYGEYVFHLVQDDGMIFLCIADAGMASVLPYQFLKDLMERWRAAYGDKGKTAPAFAMTEDFRPTMKRQMEHFSSDAGLDRVTKVQGQVEEVKQVMMDNIHKVLARGEKLDTILDRTEQLNANALGYKKRSTALKRAMW